MTSRSIERLLRPKKDSKYTFVNPPTKADEDYIRQFREKFIRECSRTPGLLAAYEDSRTFHKGVGVWRFIGVFEPKLVAASKGDLNSALEKADEEKRINAELFCLSPELFENLNWLDCLLVPEHVWGKNFTVKPLPQEQKRYQYVIRVMDLFVSGYLEPFVAAGVQREVNSKNFLVQLERLCILLDFAKQILREDAIQEWDVLRKDAAEVLSDWYESGLLSYMKIMPFIRDALTVVLDVVARLDAYFVKSNIVNFKPGLDVESPQAAFVTEEQASAFIHPWNPARALEIMLRLRKEHDQFVDVLPATFALQLYEYTRGNESFHRYVKTCFKMESMTGHMERPNLSAERGIILDKYTNFIMGQKLKSNSGLIFGCNIRSGFAVAKAMNLMKSRQNTTRRNRFLKLLLQSEQHAFAHGT